jgi:hypothetical protein
VGLSSGFLFQITNYTGPKMATTEYLDDERKKLWEAVTRIEKDLKNKSSDQENEARQDSRKISEFRNKSQKSKEIIDGALNDSHKALEEINLTIQEIEIKSESVKKTYNEASNISAKLTILGEKIQNIELLFSDKESLNEKINALEEMYKSGSETASKITATYNNLLKRKKEIDDLYFEIIGFEDENEETGEVTKEKGIKDQLEQTYDQIKNEIEALKQDLLLFKKSEKENYKNDLSKNKEMLNERMETLENEYNETSQKIRALLPDALTAGLSHAFSEKRKEEILDGKKLNTYFFLAILGLVLISLIPFIINMYMLREGKTLESIISDAPRIVLAILPLYIPFLWLAYFSNKRINLSKRLVEEYTHKEVLSKTFEGLSKQIESIEDEDMSEELRIKLLYNILDVSSENPGKLISDYNKADHPVMDVLEKSFKLSNAVDSLKKIPGMKKVAKILDERTASMLDAQANKIEAAIDSVTDQK